MYGKYPYEPYGYQGGIMRHETGGGAASGIGFIVGWLIATLMVTSLKIGSALIKLTVKSLCSICHTFSAGIVDSLDK